MIRIAGTIIVALAGLVFGGILNTAVDTWTARDGPRGKLAVCRNCGANFSSLKAAPRSNWLGLRRSCSNCAAGALRYPLVALAVAATWAVAAWQSLPALYLPRWDGISIFDALVFGSVKMILSWLLIALAVMDAENRWLPDWLTLGGAALGLAFSAGRFAVYSIWRTIPLHWSLESSLRNHRQHLFDSLLAWMVGILILPGIVGLGRWSYSRIRNQEGVRAGEAKLMLLLAAWLGLSHALLAFVLGIMLAAAAALVLALRGGRTRFWMTNPPFASFLCVGGILSGFWGTKMIEAYLRWSDFA